MEKQVIWLFGLSGAGKTTISLELKKFFQQKNLPIVLLDGDEVRSTVNSDLGFSENDRKENIRRAAEIAKLLVNQNMFVIAAFITPTRAMREIVRKILQNQVELFFIDTSIEECIRRDVKGLYKKAQYNQISNFTGISDIFERPTNEYTRAIKTHQRTPSECANEILEYLISKNKVSDIDNL